MHIIEPHIHMYSRTTDDYQAMWEAGIRVVVEPAFWLGQNRRYAGTFYDYFAHILEFETERARKFGIDHYAAIAVNPKECENAALANEVIDGMAEYLDHPRCVAMGEIGMNMMALEYAGALLVIDCGLMFPEARMLGIDLVLPEYCPLLKETH